MTESKVNELDKQLDEIYERLTDYDIFHDRNDGDFKSYGKSHIFWAEAKTEIIALFVAQALEALPKEHVIVEGDKNIKYKQCYNAGVRDSRDALNKLRGGL